LTVLVILISAVLVAVAAAWGAKAVAGEIRAARRDASRARLLALVTVFAPAAAAVESDPRALLTWYPLARAARKLFAEEFAALDRAAGAEFPFPARGVQDAHARWTADWLAWEQAHDAEYKLKAAAIEEEIKGSEADALSRARLDAVEREKLERYQRRYEEYIRVAKALQQLEAVEVRKA